jgi:tetratricopeptide repeat protein 8
MAVLFVCALLRCWRCVQDMLVLTHQRAKVCLRMDQPLAALQLYSSAAEQHPGDVGLLLAQARIQEAVGQHAQSLSLYQQVCATSSCSACSCGGNGAASCSCA